MNSEELGNALVEFIFFGLLVFGMVAAASVSIELRLCHDVEAEQSASALARAAALNHADPVRLELEQVLPDLTAQFSDARVTVKIGDSSEFARLTK